MGKEARKGRQTKLKRERQERRKKEQEKTTNKKRDQMEAVLAKWMTTREEQANKEQSPEGARGEKGEELTGKRKREEEEKPGIEKIN